MDKSRFQPCLERGAATGVFCKGRVEAKVFKLKKVCSISRRSDLLAPRAFCAAKRSKPFSVDAFWSLLA